MKIDFVVLWVDGDDQSWIDCYNNYRKMQYPLSPNIDKFRFRDMKTFNYLFRSFEKYTPWVNKIHVVTCGHYPEWLNALHPKINLVKHSDFIPHDYLPTFNSTSIEMFLDRIPELSEKFVYFNDDMIINKPLPIDFFFQNNKPCDFFSIAPNIEKDLSSYPYGAMIHSVTTLINSKFSPRVFCKNHFNKYFNCKYGIKINLKNLNGLTWWGFFGFGLTHSAQPYLKSTFKSVWELFYDDLKVSAKSKFREPSNLSQYLFRYYQLVNGEFSVVSPKKRFAFYNISKGNLTDVVNCLSKEDISIICLNDSEKLDDFDFIISHIKGILNIRFPTKSSYEL
ncbi:Stealth CR1 domain-containing protein [Rosenbergiella nectarea]|uniref:Stealth CR1 domain-containing protein n=2 Tax=Rosenbergiella nectarea TaxID=988801 RepID=UPI001F4F8E3F|nr:Stealth CR1 domain-containing protein [Rosenbergiella nectarea]